MRTLPTFLTCVKLFDEIASHANKKFFKDVNSYIWDDPVLYKRDQDSIMRKCVQKKKLKTS